MAHAGYKYEVANPHDSQCALTAGLNELYRMDETKPLEPFEQFVRMPDAMGSGCWQRTQPRRFVEIALSEARFRETITLSSVERDGGVNLAFCLGESIHWRNEEEKKEFGIGSGEVAAYGSVDSRNSCRYEAGRHFKGLTIKLDPVRLQGEWQQFPSLERWASALQKQPAAFDGRPMTPALKRLVHELVACPYAGEIQRMYMTGKVMEMFAVYLNETVMERSVRAEWPGLSRSNIDSLHQAKQILDAALAAPPGLAALAKRVALNEFKLKKGFKLLFGMPVHAYIIDRRLETAYALLQEGKLTITEAAYAAGFGKAGHFTEYFRRKYGVTPSEYLKSFPRPQK